MQPGNTGNGSPEAGHQKNAGVRRIYRNGFLALCLVVVLIQILQSETRQEEIFDLYQEILPREITEQPVTIVEIDEQSLLRIGPWPWPRHRLAELITAIHRAGALAIGLDILLPQPDQTAPSQFIANYTDAPAELRQAISELADPDKVLADVIARLPVVVARAGIDDTAGADGKGLPRYAGFAGDPAPANLLSYPRAISNLPAFDQGAIGHGLLNALVDPDGTVRRMPLLAKVGEQTTPSLALEVLRVAHGADDYILEADKEDLKAITLSDYRIPTGPDGSLRVHFSNPVELRYLSALDVLEGSFAPAALNKKMVLITATALGLDELIATPVASESLGVDAHAQTIEVIFASVWLSRPAWMPYVEMGLLLVLSFLAIRFLPSMRPPPAFAVSLGLFAGLFGIGLLVFAESQFLFNPITPGAGAGIVALTVLGTMLVEADRRRKALQEALQLERLETARTAGELDAAREIQAGMLPGRAQLQNLPTGVDVAALLEPALEVSGDFYDAFMLDAQHLFLMIGDVTGKGVPASLFMALSKALTKSALLRSKKGLLYAVETAHEEIARENVTDLFVTAIFARFDIASGTLELINAGHENPTLLRPGDPPKELVLAGGPPLCVIPDHPYSVETTQLMPGDHLIFTTDGASEASSPAGDFLGTPGIQEGLAKTEKAANSESIAQHLAAVVRRHEAGQEPSTISPFGVGLPGAGRIVPTCKEPALRYLTSTSTRRLRGSGVSSAVATSNSRSPRPTARSRVGSISSSMSNPLISTARSRESSSLYSRGPTVSVWPTTCTSTPGRASTSASMAASSGSDSGTSSVVPNLK